VTNPLLRVVLDTNVMLRGLISPSSAAAEVLAAADKRQFITQLPYHQIIPVDNLVVRSFGQDLADFASPFAEDSPDVFCGVVA
jgi:hypothetical protein